MNCTMPAGGKDESSIIEKAIKAHDDIEKLRRKRPRVFWKLLVLCLIGFLIWNAKSLYSTWSNKEQSDSGQTVQVHNTVVGDGIAGGTVYGDVTFQRTTSVTNISHSHQNTLVSNSSSINQSYFQTNSKVFQSLVSKGFSAREIIHVQSVLKEHLEIEQIEKLIPVLFVSPTSTPPAVVVAPGEKTSGATVLFFPLKSDGWYLTEQMRNVTRIGRFSAPVLTNILGNLSHWVFSFHVVETTDSIPAEWPFALITHSATSETNFFRGLLLNGLLWTFHRTWFEQNMYPISRTDLKPLLSNSRGVRLSLGDSLENDMSLSQSLQHPTEDMVLNVFGKEAVKWLETNSAVKMLIVVEPSSSAE